MLGWYIPANRYILNGVNIVEWIPVKEKIPEKGQTIIACGIRGAISIGVYLGKRESAIGSFHAAKFYGRVSEYCRFIAWMPLPAPYVDMDAQQQYQKILKDYQFRHITRRRKKQEQ